MPLPKTFVSYTYLNEREAEREFSSLKDALAFADSIIENGGHADVSTEETFDAPALRYCLCDIHQLTT